MEITKQAAWVFQNIFETRKVLIPLRNCSKFLIKGEISIQKLYAAVRGDVQTVPWRPILKDNMVAPHTSFITRVALWGRLQTKDRVVAWDQTVDQTCVLCH